MTIWRMCIACCITEATITNTEYVIQLFRGNSSYANAPQSYVTRTFPLLPRSDLATYGAAVWEELSVADRP
jgi:hypothetical protein